MVIDPGHLQRGQKEHLKLHLPKCLFHRKPGVLIRGETIQVEGDMLGFVAEQECAHLPEDLIGRALLKQTIIGRTDEFGDNDHLHFKRDTQRSTHQTKQGMSPMLFNELALVSLDQSFEQAGVLFFFLDEEGKRFPISGIIGMGSLGFAQ